MKHCATAVPLVGIGSENILMQKWKTQLRLFVLKMDVASTKFGSVHELRKHLERSHGYPPFSLEEKHFDNFEQFESWKSGVENDTHANFIIRQSHVQEGGIKSKYFFLCSLLFILFIL